MKREQHSSAVPAGMASDILLMQLTGESADAGLQGQKHSLNLEVVQNVGCRLAGCALGAIHTYADAECS
jgi:hypothetical protein